MAIGPDPSDSFSLSTGGGTADLHNKVRARDNYLIEYTVGSIIRSSLAIYFHHFGTLLLIFALPVLPVAMVQAWDQESGDTGLSRVAVLVLFMGVYFFAYAATTVAVSDVCLGNAPSFYRSYRKILGPVVLLLVITTLLQTLVTMIGLLLIIPGLLLAVWLLVTAPVVVLERKAAFGAFKRSKQLCDGSHWRNAAVLLLTILISAVVGMVVGAMSGALLRGIEGAFPELFSDWMINWLLIAVLAVVQHGLVTPISLISLVLVYYDRRVRKEGYDTKTLAEDLAR